LLPRSSTAFSLYLTVSTTGLDRVSNVSGGQERPTIGVIGCEDFNGDDEINAGAPATIQTQSVARCSV